MISLYYKNNKWFRNIIKLLINNKTEINHRNKYGETSLINVLRFNYDFNKVKLFINDKTDLIQKDEYKRTLFMIALINKYNENILKLFINNKMISI